MLPKAQTPRLRAPEKLKGGLLVLYPGTPLVSSSRPLAAHRGGRGPCHVWQHEGTLHADFQELESNFLARRVRRRLPTTPINLAQVRLIQMQLSSQIIEESCDSYPDLLLHARIPVLARPHARGASCGELQLEACRGSRSSSSNSSPVGSERSCRVSAVYMHREPSARAASHVGSVPV